MKYSREELKSMSSAQYTNVLCKELNDAGFKVMYNNGSTAPFVPSWDVFELSIAENAQAVQYLRELGLIDNGKCPLCTIHEDNLQYRQRNPKSGEWYHICKSCYQRSEKKNRIIKGCNSSCCLGMIAVLSMIIYILVKMFS